MIDVPIATVPAAIPKPRLNQPIVRGIASPPRASSEEDEVFESSGAAELVAADEVASPGLVAGAVGAGAPGLAVGVVPSATSVAGRTAGATLEASRGGAADAVQAAVENAAAVRRAIARCIESGQTSGAWAMAPLFAGRGPFISDGRDPELHELG
jgi:hypothetical protein